LVHVWSTRHRSRAVDNGLQRSIIRPGSGGDPAETGPGGSDQGHRRRAPERQGTFPAALAQDKRDAQIEVEVDDPQAGDVAAAGAGVQQDGDEAVSRRASKPSPAHAASSRRSASSGTTGKGLSGTIGGFMRAIGLTAISPAVNWRTPTR
jgi:hypothetical protein